MKFNSYNDIMNYRSLGNSVMKKLLKEDPSIKDVLQKFREDYPEFQNYKDYHIFAILNHYKSIEKIMANVPMCHYCGKKRCVIDSTYNAWLSSDTVSFKTFCGDRECISQNFLALKKIEMATKSPEQIALENARRKAGIHKKMAKDKDLILQHRNETIRKLYGVDNVSQLNEVKQKKKDTSFEHYGVSSPQQSEEIQTKTKATNMKRYGYEHVSQAPRVKEKMKETMNNRTEEEKAEIKAKHVETNLQRYNCEWVSQAPEFKQKQMETIHNKTEEEKAAIKKKRLDTWNAKSEEEITRIRESKRQKLLNKTEEERAEILQKQKLSNAKLRYNHFLTLEAIPRFTFEEFLEVYTKDTEQQYIHEFTWHCNKCGKDFKSPVNDNFYHKCGYKSFARCMDCYPFIAGFSKGEKEVYDYIRTFYHDEIIENARGLVANNKQQELDIYIPDKHIAFEYDGIYWHSELSYEVHDNVGRDSTYHLLKTEGCNQSGIRLIHILETEWHHKESIVKSRIKNLLGCSSMRIPARRCEVKEISPQLSRTFQETNHLQGAIGARVHLGLYYGDQLVSLMTFGKPRYNDNYEWELLRFCNMLDTSVMGGAGKLLSYFENVYKPKSIISYADRRWSNGGLYDRLGFTLDHASEPNYWYWHNDIECKLISRIEFQKHKLEELLDNFDDSLSEVENMHNNGYERIFDCGNLVYVKEY